MGITKKMAKMLNPENHAAPGSTLRVAAAQMESKARDKEFNLSKIESFVKRAANRGLKLISFPECCLTGYWFIRNLKPAQLEKLAEPVPGGTSLQRIVKLAKQYEDALLVFKKMNNLVWQGQMLDLLGRREEAVQCYQQALQKNACWGRHDQYGINASAYYVRKLIAKPFVRVENNLK